MPNRNHDGSINWANIFAVSMQLARPIRRSDVFPEGTGGMSREDIIGKACEFVARCSTRRNYAPVTTAWDPVEFPEVVDPEFHDVAAKINGTDFARTIDSWAGHAYRANGFLTSKMTIMVDIRNPKGKRFRETVSDIMDEWNQKERIRVYSVGDDFPDNLLITFCSGINKTDLLKYAD